MNNVLSVLNSTVSISQFNRGLAGKIFADVKKSGTKVVMKNNEPEAVIMSPDEYRYLMERMENDDLIAAAAERLKNYDPEKLIPGEQVMAENGITREMLDAMEDVAIE